MYIIEKGKSKTNMKLMEEAMDYFVSSLKIPQKTNVTVAFTDLHMGKRFQGRCWSHEDEHLVYIRKSMESSQQLKILAHELTHVKQHVRNEYVFEFDESVGKARVMHHGEDVGFLEEYDYTKSPWELEAKRNEYHLYMKFVNQKQKT